MDFLAIILIAFTTYVLKADPFEAIAFFCSSRNIACFFPIAPLQYKSRRCFESNRIAHSLNPEAASEGK